MAPVDSRDYVFWCDGTRFYIYSNEIVFRLNQLGNSFNIFTPGDVRNTMWPVNTPSKHETLT